MDKTYQTSRLYLKVLKPYHVKNVLEYYTRNAEFLKEWDPVREPYFYTLECQKSILRDEYLDYKRGKSIKFWLINKENNKIIGNICFSNIILGNFKSCFLAYKLDKDEINKGYITEALSKGIKIMFNRYGMHRIEVNIIPRNYRSLRIVEKLNFEKEGFSRNYLKINGVWEDHYHFAKYNDKDESI
ncbi:GNAT family N-acetyltransferase [Sedimentibacter sp. zth1]|nr:GNAT family N-acetyltransferase [Sedimentibacter sp. zth1]QSX07358.1 GNAT family N-acetyltransferase [Sedimentibacter sp. zth1]